MIVSLEKYTKNTREIRMLSTPSLESVNSPEEYESILQENFKKIGELAEENRELLSRMLDRDSGDNSSLDIEEIKEVINLFQIHVYGGGMENLDLSLSNRISSYLWDQVLETADTDLAVMIADMHAMSCYLMMNYSRRTHPFTMACEEYREMGKKACDYLMSFLDFDKWIEIENPQTRQIILKKASFKYVFYTRDDQTPDRNEKAIEVLHRAISIEKQKLYKETFSEQDWIIYKLRLRECMGALLDSGNARGLSYPQCCEIKKYTDELMDLWREYPEICMENFSYGLDMLYYYRALYFTGDINGTTYKEKLLEIYRSRSTKRFSRADVILNLLLPLEYVVHMEKRRMAEGEFAVIEQFYRNAINYVFQCPNLGSIVYILDYLLQLLSHFKEIPGGTTFEEVGLDCMAALHPPTYVHSKMVANITRCLCKHLLRIHPEYFATMVGSEDVETILTYRGEILDHAYHAALCHDFGKIAIMDTVFMYGRNITDYEFEQIKSHPQIGAALVSDNPSTAKYRHVAIGHHRWYDDKSGYPGIIDTQTMREQILINVVTCADCMDAATDSAGRSYNKGITLDEFIDEIRQQSGTRYAPFLPELLENEEVREDLDFLLSEVRNVIYRDTFVMLKRLQRLGGYTEIYGGFKGEST